jgi:hypothetical protein
MSAARGNEGEAAVLHALITRGFDVLIPFGEGQAYDLVVDLGGRFIRVQCKTARKVPGCLAFNSHATDHGHGPASYIGRADIFGIYFPGTGAVYLVPVADVGCSEGRLRLEPTRNNQRRRIRLACDYGVDQWSAERLREALVTAQLSLAA